VGTTSCVLPSTSLPCSHFYIFPSSPTAAAVASRVHVPCVCLIHVAGIIYICHVHYIEV
jgi:hypothetical protein